MEPTKAFIAVSVVVSSAISGAAGWVVYERVWKNDPARTFKSGHERRSLPRLANRTAPLDGWRTELTAWTVVQTAPSGRRYTFPWRGSSSPSETDLAHMRARARRLESHATLVASGEGNARRPRDRNGFAAVPAGYDTRPARPRPASEYSLEDELARLAEGSGISEEPERLPDSGDVLDATPTRPASMGSTRPGEDAPPDDALPSYDGLGSGHWIQAVSDGGRLIEFDDGSLWEIEDADRDASAQWQPEDDITVMESTGPGGYLLVNRATGDRLQARHLGG